MTPKPPKPLVCIIWRDSEDGPTWATETEVHAFADQECLVESIGRLIKKTKTFYVLAADRSLSGNNPGEVGRLCKIPRRMVTAIHEIAFTTPETPPSADPQSAPPPPRPGPVAP